MCVIFFLLDCEGFLKFDYFLVIEIFFRSLVLGKCVMGYFLCFMIYYRIILGFGFFEDFSFIVYLGLKLFLLLYILIDFLFLVILVWLLIIVLKVIFLIVY